MTSRLVPPPDEHLTTGWEQDLPAGDTLLRRAVLVHAGFPVAVARAAGRPWRSGPRWAGAWIGDRGGLTNWVVLRQPPTDIGGVIAEIHELFPPAVPYLLISPWPLPDLQSLGLALIGHPPLMVRFPGPRPAAAADAALRLREVRTAADLAVAERVLVEGYPMPDLQPLSPGDLLAPAVLDGPTRVWLAELEGQPVAVSAAHTTEGATLVEYVAALPTARGRGAGAEVTWAATLADPRVPAMLLASDDGRPVYERMGYLAVQRWSAWLRSEVE